MKIGKLDCRRIVDEYGFDGGDFGLLQLFEKNDLKADEDLVIQYLQNRRIAKEFAVYYDLFMKYKEDYQVGKILQGKADEKIRIVQACVEEKLSQAEAASRAGVDEASVRDWLVRYRSEGSLGFVEQDQRAYSAELKLQAVTDYLSGGLSQRKICEKYHIRSNRQLRCCVYLRTFKKCNQYPYSD